MRIKRRFSRRVIKTKDPSPFPEVLPGTKGQDWDVVAMPSHLGISGSLDPINKVMRVPMDKTPQAQNVRAHELGHGAWSIPQPPSAVARRAGVSVEALQHAEDLRINTMLSLGGVDINTDGFRTDEEVQEFGASTLNLMEKAKRKVDAIRMTTLALVSSATVSSADNNRFHASVHPLILGPAYDIALRAHRMMFEGIDSKNKYIPHIRTLRVARMLDTEHKKMQEAEAKEAEDAKKRALQQAKKDEQAKQMIKKFGDKVPDTATFNSKWGPMDMHTPPLTQVSAIQRAMTIKRATDSGVKITRLDRILSDGKVFTMKRKIPGGTIVIDGSGSMHLKRSQIKSILLNAPHATVAIYSGGARGPRGMLRILAKNGRMASEQFIAQPDGGGNVVDGPALRWLCTQEEPRVWVSDGGVCGIDGGLHLRGMEECDALVKVGGITQLPHVKEALQFFKDWNRPKTRGLLEINIERNPGLKKYFEGQV